MLRIDRSVTPTMAKAPTLGDVGARAAAHHRARRTPRPHRHGRAAAGSTFDGRLGRGRRRRARRELRGRRPEDARRACRSGGPEAITLQPIRAGFPCFGAALAGYVEATRDDDDREEPAVPAVVVRQHAGRLGHG